MKEVDQHPFMFGLGAIGGFHRNGLVPMDVINVFVLRRKDEGPSLQNNYDVSLRRSFTV